MSSSQTTVSCNVPTDITAQLYGPGTIGREYIVITLSDKRIYDPDFPGRLTFSNQIYNQAFDCVSALSAAGTLAVKEAGKCSVSAEVEGAKLAQSDTQASSQPGRGGEGKMILRPLRTIPLSSGWYNDETRDIMSKQLSSNSGAALRVPTLTASADQELVLDHITVPGSNLEGRAISATHHFVSRSQYKPHPVTEAYTARLAQKATLNKHILNC